MVTQINIDNAVIDMNSNSITGTANLQVPSLIQVTDADMCIERESNPEKFAFALLEYATVRVTTPAGKYIDNGVLNNSNNKPYMSNFPDLQLWAGNIVQQVYPEYYPMIDSVSLYAGGGFSIMCRIYLDG